MEQQTPKLLWPLEMHRFVHEGQDVVSLRCPRGIAPSQAVFPAAMLPIMARFDGTRTLGEIVEEGASYGVTLDLLRQLVAELQGLHFLETPETQQRWEAMKDDYRKLKIREAALAGSVYPADPGELRSHIQEMTDEAQDWLIEKPRSSEVVGFLSPHIDYPRGRKTYAAASQVLGSMERPDIIVLLGTSHQWGTERFRLTTKDFSIPGGVFPFAREVFDSLANQIDPERLLKDELTHKTEHSLELQLPLLLHHFSEDLPVVLPILVSSFGDVLNGDFPEDIDQFIDALVEALKKERSQGRNILFYAGVDFAHMGQHFGDQERVSDAHLDEIEEQDRKMFDMMLAGDSQGLFEHIAEDEDRRRVCGFPAVYTMLETMNGLGMDPEGHFVDYRQSVDRETDTIVTFGCGFWTQGD